MKLLRLFIIATGVFLGMRDVFSRRDPGIPMASESAPGLRGTRINRWLLPAGALLAAVGVVATLVLISGIVPIKASSRHWPITAWLLDFAKRRSVATHTIGLEVPRLGDRAQVLKGAGQYENACRPCHGSPEMRTPSITQQMTPQPPYLPPRIPAWAPAELFYIVKHGIKFTGMPAWPAQRRDDEVWAMVAFLMEFPELSEGQYRELVAGRTASRAEAEPVHRLVAPPPPSVIENCGRCHGVDGRGRGVGAFPRLMGQSSTYIELALRAYGRGERHSGIMEPIAAGLSEATMSETASYYGSAVPQALALAPTSSALIGRGADIATRGIPQQQVPPCVECHGPTTALRNPAYPRLAGQYVDYLTLQLRLFATNRRGGSPYAEIMRSIASRLTDAQIEEVASFFASLADPPIATGPQ